MPHDAEPTTTSSARLTRDELADLVGDPVERVRELTARGVIRADDAGRYAPGDAHRIRRDTLRRSVVGTPLRAVDKPTGLPIRAV